MNRNHRDDLARPIPDPSFEELQEARLTAYALGQLSGQERADVEAELAASETARRAVEVIQALADHVREATLAADVPASAALRAALEARLVEAPVLPAVVPAGDRGSIRRSLSAARRRWRAWVGVAAAACLLLVGTVGFYLGRSRPDAQIGPANVAMETGDATSQPSAPKQAPVGPGTPGALARSTGAEPEHLGKGPRGERPTPGAGGAAAISPRSGTGDTSGPGSTVKGGAPAPDERKSSDTATSTGAAPAGASPMREPVPPQAATETPKTGVTDRREPAAAGQDGIPVGAPTKRPPATISPETPSSHDEPVKKALAALNRPRPSRAIRRPAADPAFLWPVGPIGPVYMSTRPPEIVVPPPPGKRKDAAGTESPGALGTFGKGGPAAEAKGTASGGKQAGAGATDSWLPPGMRPGTGKSVDVSKGAKKGKGSSPATLEAAPPEEPVSSDVVENDFLPAEKFPYSTFSLEVDRGVYPWIARSLSMRHMPPADRVQIEDMINYFRYDDPQPAGDAPFSLHVETSECPWARGHRLVRIAISARRTATGRAEASRPGQEKAGPLRPIAKDVRVQLKFNPALAASYRLIGYDGPPAGAQGPQEDSPAGVSVAPGHTVTALYEVIPAQPQSAKPGPVEGHPAKSHRSPPRDPTAVARSEDLVTVRLRYQRPGAEKYWLLECPVTDSGESFAAASRDFQFTAAVAAFGMALRGSQYRGDITWEAIEKIADSARGEDPEGLREEFVELVRIARQLSPGR